MPLVFSSKYYLFFPVAFLDVNSYELLLSSHALIGHQGPGNTQWPEQRQLWHFSAMSFCFFLGISCPSRPLHPLIASLAVQHHPPSTQNPAASKRGLLHQRKKKPNHHNCLETQNIFFWTVSWLGLLVFFGFLWQKRPFKTPGERSRLCWGRSNLVPCSKRGGEQSWALGLWPSLGPSSSTQTGMGFGHANSWLCTPNTEVMLWLSAAAH